MNSGLEAVRRPGEDKTPEIRPSEAVAMPVHDEDKVKFREVIKTLMNAIELPAKTKEHFDIFMEMTDKEMMSRKSYQTALSNRMVVFEAFQKEFPNVKIEDFVMPDHPNYSVFETIFKKFGEKQLAITDAMHKATIVFNTACAHIMTIEKVEADESRSDDDKKLAVAVATKDLFDLLKGFNKVE